MKASPLKGQEGPTLFDWKQLFLPLLLLLNSQSDLPEKQGLISAPIPFVHLLASRLGEQQKGIPAGCGGQLSGTSVLMESTQRGTQGHTD